MEFVVLEFSLVQSQIFSRGHVYQLFLSADNLPPTKTDIFDTVKIECITPSW